MLKNLTLLICTVCAVQAYSSIYIDLTSGSVQLPSMITLSDKSRALVIDIRARPKLGYSWHVVDKSLLTSDGDEILKVKKIREKFRGPSTIGSAVNTAVTEIVIKPVI